MRNKFIFSIVIPVKNGEKTLDNLLSILEKNSLHYNIEIIIIDSQSTDRSLEIIDKWKKIVPEIKLISIKAKNFNHGGTRNLGASLARGRYVCFLSQDVSPRNDFLKYFLEDLVINSRVAAVFGKQIPYKDTPLIQKIDINSQFAKLDQFARGKPLIQDINDPFLPYTDENKFVWYCLFNPFSCYRKSFLQKNPFLKTNHGEDILMGRTIIEQGLVKIYDPRAKVTHSHYFNIADYYDRSKKDIILWSGLIDIRRKVFLLNKMKSIFSMKIGLLTKIHQFWIMLLSYMLKAIIILELKVFGR